jgi:hypothetical protein
LSLLYWKKEKGPGEKTPLKIGSWQKKKLGREEEEKRRNEE